MQYLEFLAFQHSENNTTTVIKKLIIKNYLITTTSILEMLFAQIIDLHDKMPRRRIGESILLEKSQTQVDNIPYYKITKLHKIINNKITRKELKFSTSIDIVSKYNFLDIDKQDRMSLQKLRKLRNRVHLSVGISHLDHDYNNFNFDIYMQCKKLLIKIIHNMNKDNDSSKLIKLINSKL